MRPVPGHEYEPGTRCIAFSWHQIPINCIKKSKNTCPAIEPILHQFCKKLTVGSVPTCTRVRKIVPILVCLRLERVIHLNTLDFACALNFPNFIHTLLFVYAHILSILSFLFPFIPNKMTTIHLKPAGRISHSSTQSFYIIKNCPQVTYYCYNTWLH